MQQSVRNVCTKFKVDCLSRFPAGTCHVLTKKTGEIWKIVKPFENCKNCRETS